MGKKTAVWQPERLDPKKKPSHKKKKTFKLLKKVRPRKKVTLDSGSFLKGPKYMGV